MTAKLPHAQGFSAYFIQFFAAMALFTFFFIDIEVETQEKKMTFTQEFSWVSTKTNKQKQKNQQMITNKQQNMSKGLESTGARFLRSNVFLRHFLWSWWVQAIKYTAGHRRYKPHPECCTIIYISIILIITIVDSIRSDFCLCVHCWGAWSQYVLPGILQYRVQCDQPPYVSHYHQHH